MHNKKGSAQGHFFVLKHDIHPVELDLLAMSAPDVVLIQIALHRLTPWRTLSRLAAHTNPDVRAAVGENSNTPKEILWRLCADASPDVRFCLAENHNLSVDILRGLTYDENPYVAGRAQKTLQRILEALRCATGDGAQAPASYVACA